jgi:hypothetical protein
VVRVGTHALTETSKATLWGRLRRHRGQLTGRNPGGGNHRASVFRRHVGAALIRRDGLPDDLLWSWLDRHRPPRERASQEADIEREVSRHIGAMPFLWLSVPGRTDRGYLERNSIAPLSCLTGGPDQPGASWLGRYAEPSRNPRVGPMERRTRHRPLRTPVPPATSPAHRPPGVTISAPDQRQKRMFAPSAAMHKHAAWLLPAEPATRSAVQLAARTALDNRAPTPNCWQALRGLAGMAVSLVRSVERSRGLAVAWLKRGARAPV